MWHLVSAVPTSPGTSVDVWVNLQTVELGFTQTELLPALETAEPGAEPDQPTLRTKWESPPGVEHEVTTPKKLNEDPDVWAKRHESYVAAMFKTYPPPATPPPGGG